MAAMAWAESVVGEIEAMFADNRRLDEGVAVVVDRSFWDPHRDADRWISASPSDRASMADSFEAKLRVARSEWSLAILRTSRRRAAYMRAWRASSPTAPSRWPTMTPDKRERQREYVRQWRARQREAKLAKIRQM